MYRKRCADLVPHVDCAAKHVKMCFLREKVKAGAGRATAECSEGRGVMCFPRELQTERMISRMSEKNSARAQEGNVPLYLFRSGKNSHAYEYMGVHSTVRDGRACTVCRVWAPNAQAVAITGEFCGWDPKQIGRAHV